MIRRLYNFPHRREIKYQQQQEQQQSIEKDIGIFFCIGNTFLSSNTGQMRLASQLGFS